MRLLVSVRSAAEVTAAVSGGADIIDAKEPARGSLGAVDEPTLRAIVAALPPSMPLSVALGDLQDPADVGAAIAPIERVRCGGRELYVKVGLAGVRDAWGASAVLAAAARAAAAAAVRPSVVAVAYADHESAGAPAPELVSQLSGELGARGVLLDTWTKGAGDLFTWMSPASIERWLVGTRRRGLVAAVAGSLSAAGVRRISELPADIVGVRGAACRDGRAGTVEAERVRALARALHDRSPVRHATSQRR